MSYVDSGFFKLKLDTIYLYSTISKSITAKFLVGRVTQDENDTNKGILYENQLAEVYSRGNYNFKTHEDIKAWKYVKHRYYYNNGNVKSDFVPGDQKLTYSEFYETGKIKSVAHYTKFRKSGKWYYYKQDGAPYRYEVYKWGVRLWVKNFVS